MAKLVRYVVGTYVGGALVTAGVVWSFVSYEPSSKDATEAAYYTIVWPFFWWREVSSAGLFAFGLFLYGLVNISPILLLVAAVAWGTRIIMRRHSRRSD